MAVDTKEKLLDTGLALLLQHGYNDLGVQALLQAAGVPKGSFYHHFESKEDFALKVVDRYMTAVHGGLDQCLGNTRLRPLERIRAFFAAVEDSYHREGYLGCMLGGLGQELSGVNETFRKKIEGCLSYIASRLATCLEEATRSGELPESTDPGALANVLVNCWEGAALRSRLLRNPAPLRAMLDFYFSTADAR
jgi:TetR/AcrR family transcriptional repressor of nem operon